MILEATTPLCSSCLKPRARNNRNFTGLCRDCNHYKNKPESRNYSTIHKWLVEVHGNPGSCERCGVAGYLNKGGRWNIHWANMAKDYEKVRDNFIGLCVSCHLKNDRVILNIKHMRGKVHV